MGTYDEFPVHEIPRMQKQHGASVSYLRACHEEAARRAIIQQLSGYSPSGFSGDAPPRAVPVELPVRASLKAYRAATTLNVR